jgi:hypothetical protein
LLHLRARRCNNKFSDRGRTLSKDNKMYVHTPQQYVRSGEAHQSRIRVKRDSRDYARSNPKKAVGPLCCGLTSLAASVQGWQEVSTGTCSSLEAPEAKRAKRRTGFCNGPLQRSVAHVIYMRRAWLTYLSSYVQFYRTPRELVPFRPG